MAKRIQKPRTSHTGEWVYCNFSAHPEEKAKWELLAQVDRRTLSFWIRDALNHYVAELEHVAQRQGYDPYTGKAVIPSKDVAVEEVSPDRA